jgi:uncharacterized damage-inducible protein DinB
MDPRSDSRHLARAFAYHAWATERLIRFCAGLAPDQQELTAAGTMGSVERTLTHLVSSEQFYLRDLTSEDPPRWIESRIVPVVELLDRTRENAERWRAYLVADRDPEEAFTTNWRGHDRRVVRWESVIQALMHGAEHRTHVCSVLGANGIEPPDVSVGAYRDEQ